VYILSEAALLFATALVFSTSLWLSPVTYVGRRALGVGAFTSHRHVAQGLSEHVPVA